MNTPNPLWSEAAVQLATSVQAHPTLSAAPLQPLLAALSIIPLLEMPPAARHATPAITALRLAESCPLDLPAPHLLRLNLLANLGYRVQPATSHTPTPPLPQLQLLVRPDGDIWLRLPAPTQPNTWWQGEARTVAVTKNPRGQRLHLTPLASLPQQSEKTVGALCRRFSPLLGPLVLLSLGIQGLGLLVPVLTMIVYDRVIAGHAPVGYHTLVTGLMLVLAFEMLLRHLRGRLLAWLGTRWDTLANTLVVGQLLHLPAAMIERAAVSSQLSRLRGFEVIRDVATSPIILGLLDLPFVALVLVALYTIGGALVWVPLGQLAVYLVGIYLLTPVVNRTMAQAAQAHEVRQRLMLETCRQLPSLRADGLSEHWVTRLAEASANAGVSGVAGTRLQHVLEVAGQLSGSFAGLATLALGVKLVLAGDLSAGALVASMMLVWRILAPLSLLCTALPRLIQLKHTLVQFQRLLDLTPETPPLAPAPLRQLEPGVTDRDTLTATPPTLQFHQVGLRYNPEHEPVFAGLSFTLQPGQLGVVAGSNGSGKSTLLKLVLGLYQPQAGSIRLDGADIRQWQPERLRRHIAYLPQHPELFTGTIAANLRLAQPLASAAALWEALTLAGAAPAIRALATPTDDGLNAPVIGGSNGNLSVLLQYQLSLARLFLRPAGLVLADELPNAILQGPVGAAFRTWLLAQRGRRTILLVSHREDDLLQADLALGLRAEQSPLIGTPAQVQPLLMAFAAQNYPRAA